MPNKDKELEEMLSDFIGGGEGEQQTEEPSGTAREGVEQAEGEEQPKDEGEKGEVEQEAGEQSEDVGEAEGEEQTPEGEDELEAFRARMNDLAAEALGETGGEVSAEGEAEGESEEPASGEEVAAEFVTEEEFEKLFESPKSMNAVLSRVYQRALEDARKSVTTDVVGMVGKLVSEQMALHQLVTDFYARNQDLLPYRQFVGFMANKIQAQHPDWDYTKVFEETEKEVRKALKLTKEETRSRRRPAFAKAPGSRRTRTEPEIPPEQKEILDLISD